MSKQVFTTCSYKTDRAAERSREPSVRGPGAAAAMGLVAPDLPPLPSHQRMYLPAPVDALVLRVQPGDLWNRQLILHLPRRRCTADRGSIPARSEEPVNRRAQHLADAAPADMLRVPE